MRCLAPKILFSIKWAVTAVAIIAVALKSSIQLVIFSVGSRRDDSISISDILSLCFSFCFGRKKMQKNSTKRKKKSFRESGCCWFVLFIVYSACFAFCSFLLGILQWAAWSTLAISFYTRHISNVANWKPIRNRKWRKQKKNVNIIHQNINNRRTFLSTLFKLNQLQKAYWPLPLASLLPLSSCWQAKEVCDVEIDANSKHDLYLCNVMSVKRQTTCIHLICNRQKYSVLSFFSFQTNQRRKND